MKPINPGLRRRKIILFYSLAVVLPGIILGYLAYRGIRNDQALREKESRRKLELDSQAFFSSIDSSLVQYMNKLTLDSILSLSEKTDPSLLAWFVKDSNGSTKLITHQMMYLPDELHTIQPELLSQAINNEEGIRLEFIEHRFSEALVLYQNIILKTTQPTEKIQALIASARLYNKMNQPEQAKEQYEKIQKDYPVELLNGQIPLGLIASLEILKINQILEEKDEMRNNSLQCLNLLLHPISEYNKNQFDLFYESFKVTIPRIDPVIDSLFTELETQNARTDYLIRILSEPNMITTNRNSHFIGENKGMSIIPFNSTYLMAIYLSRFENNGNQTNMVIDFPVYLKSISEKLIRRLDPNSSINVKVEDDYGRLIFSNVINEENNYLSFNFPENLPQWKLLLSENKPGFIATLLNAGSGIYLVIFILIALLMVLGFIFTLYTLNEELRLNKMKSEFISNVSHELKSPLTSIRMMTEMLHHRRVQTEERKSTYYSVMMAESERLSHLIDNILDFSRMEDDRKKYNFIDLDMDDFLLKFVESIRDRIQEAKFNIHYSCPDRVPVIKADKQALLQVFYNLIDNALKFSGTSTQIDISLFLRADELHICVKDYGIGISSKDQEKIFDRFYRGDEPQRLGIKGSGIGLTIVKKIMESHNGSLTLESNPGKGSTFCVHLPIIK